MPYLRINIDMAFPLPLNSTVKTRLQKLRAEIKEAKRYARKINEGTDNEEVTVKGTYHICHHDENNVACEPTIEI